MATSQAQDSLAVITMGIVLDCGHPHAPLVGMQQHQLIKLWCSACWTFQPNHWRKAGKW